MAIEVETKYHDDQAEAEKYAAEWKNQAQVAWNMCCQIPQFLEGNLDKRILGVLHAQAVGGEKLNDLVIAATAAVQSLARLYSGDLKLETFVQPTFGAEQAARDICLKFTRGGEWVGTVTYTRQNMPVPGESEDVNIDGTAMITGVRITFGAWPKDLISRHLKPPIL